MVNSQNKVHSPSNADPGCCKKRSDYNLTSHTTESDTFFLRFLPLAAAAGCVGAVGAWLWEAAAYKASTTELRKTTIASGRLLGTCGCLPNAKWASTHVQVGFARCALRASSTSQARLQQNAAKREMITTQCHTIDSDISLGRSGRLRRPCRGLGLRGKHTSPQKTAA